MSFPLNSKQAYIKDTGERTTLGAVVGTTTSELPEYSSEEAGKVLTVNDEGDLEWDTVSGGGNRYYRAVVPGSSNIVTPSAEGGAT